MAVRTRLMEARNTALKRIARPVLEPLIEENTALRKAAYTDLLTDLGNRRAYEEALDSEQERINRKALIGRDEEYGVVTGGVVIFIDLKGLGEINRKNGHAAGDNAIKNIAETIRATFRRSSDEAFFLEKSLFRYGGDEFVILLRHVSEEKSEIPVGMLLDALEKSGISAHVGYAAYKPGSDIRDVIRMADPKGDNA